MNHAILLYYIVLTILSPAWRINLDEDVRMIMNRPLFVEFRLRYADNLLSCTREVGNGHGKNGDGDDSME